MMAAPVIEFQHVSKTYYKHPSSVLLRNYLTRRFAGRGPAQPFNALNNVSFRVMPGESLAVIGANGAGKSTVLNLIAALVPPDAGKVIVNGRVAALLELGAGFHPDLTGAENVRLNAALMGIGRKRVESVFADIVEFAEIGDFLSEPLRTYSTGMAMRLAFSVAVNVDPDVLLIDEVLAVGDQAFQAKCLSKILDFRRHNKTIICVSHASGMVQQLCDRAIWLDHGDLMLDASIDEVAATYQGALRTASS
jgi:ABC-type polysaccharide/polyol phosphate transport system ATPase subunit